MMFCRVIIITFLFFTVNSLTPAEIAAFTLRFPDMVETNTGVKAEFAITDNGDDTLTYIGNGVPNHLTSTFPLPEDVNPNIPEAAAVTIKFDKYPKIRPDGEELMCLPLGPIGFTVTGDYIYGWYAAEFNCPTAVEFEVVGICEGHPSPSNAYHQHHYSPCITMPTCGQPSGIYGVAFDGIPIYGPWDEDGIQLTHADLDVCGGKIGRDDVYKYHVTVDPPYFLGCFKGYIRKDSGLRADSFTCTCPYDDTMFGRGGNSNNINLRKRQDEPQELMPPMIDPDDVICDFEADGDYAVCEDKYNASVIMSVKWELVDTLIKLAPCCPEGEDCGDSCIEYDDDGVKVLKAPCTQESKTVKYKTRFNKTEDELHKEMKEKGWPNRAGSTCLGMYFILITICIFYV